jgi:hypothetical protein
MDAKYASFNTYKATAFLAVWPDFDDNEWYRTPTALGRLSYSAELLSAGRLVLTVAGLLAKEPT